VSKITGRRYARLRFGCHRSPLAAAAENIDISEYGQIIADDIFYSLIRRIGIMLFRLRLFLPPLIIELLSVLLARFAEDYDATEFLRRYMIDWLHISA